MRLFVWAPKSIPVGALPDWKFLLVVGLQDPSYSGYEELYRGFIIGLYWV